MPRYGGLVRGYTVIMENTLRALLLVVAVVFFVLVGFGVTNGDKHFVLVPLGLALTAASFLPVPARHRL